MSGGNDVVTNLVTSSAIKLRESCPLARGDASTSMAEDKSGESSHDGFEIWDVESTTGAVFHSSCRTAYVPFSGKSGEGGEKNESSSV